MPENSPYPGENRRMFAKRMAGQKTRFSGMAGAAKRGIAQGVAEARRKLSGGPRVA